VVAWIHDVVSILYGGKMKFLTKVGQVINRGLQILGIFEPIIQQTSDKTGQVVQVVSQDLVQIGGVITDVEAFGQALALKGPDKLKAAAGPVSQIILQSALLANHKIADPVLFQQGSTKVADGIADVINSLNPDGLQIQNKS